MALISLSDWLDRSGDDQSRALTDTELESVRIVVGETDAPPPTSPEASPAREPLRERWRRIWRRAFWRLKRQPSGPA